MVNTMDKVYKILGVDEDKGHPNKTFFLLANNMDIKKEKCEACNRFLYSEKLIIKENWFKKLKVSQKGFFFGEDDFDLLQLMEVCEKVFETMAGVKATRVGVGEDNEGFIEPSRYYKYSPAIGMAEVYGRCFVTLSEKNVILPTCPKCGTFKKLLDKNKVKYLLKSSWDGSDMFKVPGIFQPFITFNGLKYFDSIGFNNLRLEEYCWK